jgi:hypothetical protein
VGPSPFHELFGAMADYQPFAAVVALTTVVVGAAVVGGVDALQPFAALAPLEAAPIPIAVTATTARPAANRAARFGPHDVPFFDAFILMSFGC